MTNTIKNSLILLILKYNSSFIEIKKGVNMFVMTKNINFNISYYIEDKTDQTSMVSHNFLKKEDHY